jgi:DNA-binding transcriptional regulator GbsR (MarR family)
LKINRNNHLISTVNLYINPCGYYHILTNQFACRKEKLIELNETLPININSELTQDFVEHNLTIDRNDTVMINNESKKSTEFCSAII